MKKILLALLIAISFIRLQAQSGFTTYQDTANYLINEIEAKKHLYTGKYFSILLDSLKVKPTRILTHVIDKNSFGKEVSLYFNYEREFGNKHFIIIEFEQVPGYNELFPVYFPKGAGGGEYGKLQDILNVYKLLIVKDIETKDYTLDEPQRSGINYPMLIKPPKN